MLEGGIELGDIGRLPGIIPYKDTTQVLEFHRSYDLSGTTMFPEGPREAEGCHSVRPHSDNNNNNNTVYLFHAISPNARST